MLVGNTHFDFDLDMVRSDEGLAMANKVFDQLNTKYLEDHRAKIEEHLHKQVLASSGLLAPVFDGCDWSSVYSTPKGITCWNEWGISAAEAGKAFKVLSESTKSSEETPNEVEEAINTLAKEETMNDQSNSKMLEEAKKINQIGLNIRTLTEELRQGNGIGEETVNNKLPEVGSEWVCKSDETKHEVDRIDPSSNWPIRTKTQEGGGGTWSTCYFDRNFKPALEVPKIGSEWIETKNDMVHTVISNTNPGDNVLSTGTVYSRYAGDFSLDFFYENFEEVKIPQEGSYWLSESDRLVYFKKYHNGCVSYVHGKSNHVGKFTHVLSLDYFTENLKPLDEPLTNFHENGIRIKEKSLGTAYIGDRCLGEITSWNHSPTGKFKTHKDWSVSCDTNMSVEQFEDMRRVLSGNTPEPVQSSLKSSNYGLCDASTVSTPTDKHAMIKKKEYIPHISDSFNYDDYKDIINPNDSGCYIESLKRPAPEVGSVWVNSDDTYTVISSEEGHSFANKTVLVDSSGEETECYSSGVHHYFMEKGRYNPSLGSIWEDDEGKEYVVVDGINDQVTTRELDKYSFKKWNVLQFAGPLKFTGRFYEETNGDFIWGNVPRDLINTIWWDENNASEWVVVSCEDQSIVVKSLKTLAFNRMGSTHLLTSYTYQGVGDPQHFDKPRIGSKWLNGDSKVCTIVEGEYPTSLGHVHYSYQGSSKTNSWSLLGFYKKFTPLKPPIFSRAFWI